LGTRGDTSLRTVAESSIIEFLLVRGWAYEVWAGRRDEAAAAVAAALARWVEGDLPFAIGADGVRRYDPVEVINFITWSGLQRGDPFWHERFVATARRLVADECADASPGRHAGIRAREFRMIFRRNFNLAPHRPGTPHRLRLPLPLEDALLDNLSLYVTTDINGEVALTRIPGRLEARLNAADCKTVNVTYCADFRSRVDTSEARKLGRAGAHPLKADELDVYTRPREGFIQITSGVVALARELARGKHTRLEMVYAFWDYLIDHMMCGEIHYHEIYMSRPLEWLLEVGWYDCQLGSALLAGLCRAVNIPARIINGHLLYPLAPFQHYWVEVWLEDGGWTPFDLLSWGLSAGGQDRSWRNCFAQRLDYRMKTECLPRTFLGPPGVPIPSQWHMIACANRNGIRMSILDAISTAVAYCDDISVEQRGSSAKAAPLEP
jgi:hypothetical protein